MPVSAVGLSHHLIPLEELSHLGRVADPVLEQLETAGLNGWVLLNTCNRFEVYFDSHTFHGGLDAVLAAFRAALPDGQRGLVDQLQVYGGHAAVQHLLEVASGLDSMVIGESEIIGQVREALEKSGSHASAALRRLFNAALTTAKAVTTQTDLGAAGRSLAQVGLDLVEQRHFPLAGRRALVLGTGSYARVVVAALRRKECFDIHVYSSSGRAEEFAASHDIQATPREGLTEAIGAADLLITCSGGQSCSGPAISVDRLLDSRTDAAALLPVLDLSLAGDLAPGAADLVFIDLIDLEEIGANAPAGQSAAVVAARDLVTRGAETYLHLEQGRAATPAVTAIRAHVSHFIEREIEAATRRHDPETAAAVAYSLRRVSNALLHTPSQRAAQFARSGELSDYSRALQTLFGIEVEADA